MINKISDFEGGENPDVVVDKAVGNIAGKTREDLARSIEKMPNEEALEYLLKKVKKTLSQNDYDNLKARIKKVKEEGLDVSDIEREMTVVFGNMVLKHNNAPEKLSSFVKDPTYESPEDRIYF